jgi:putative aldouronate transport system permease protein
MAECKACGTELPKKAKKCPQCGTRVYQPPKNVRILAIAGAVIAFIGSLLPYIQNIEKAEKKLELLKNVQDAYSFMSFMHKAKTVYQYDYHEYLWYAFIAALVVTCILVVLKKEVFSIISTAVAAVIFAVVLNDLSSFLSDPKYGIVCGVWVTIFGLILAVAGCFIDILKLRKRVEYDTRYFTNDRTVWARIKIHGWFYVMFLPVLIFILIFNYWPMLGIRYAFTIYKAKDPTYVGLYQFYKMFYEVKFWYAFRNTLELSILKLILNTGMAVIISLLLHEIQDIWFKKTVQTIIYLPHFMSWVVVAAIFRMLLSHTGNVGLVNQVLVTLGIIDEPIYWLGEVSTWRGVYYVINVWKDTGWGTILFLATLSGISPELYEAAQIDGANRWNRMCYITLPALANTIITVFILNLAKVMNLFESVFVLKNDLVNDVADVIQTYIYDMSFGSGGVNDFGYTTAVGLFKSFVGCILVLGCDWASKKVRGRGIV